MLRRVTSIREAFEWEKSMANVTEVGPDLYRISIWAPQFGLQFNHFLVKDDQPLLFHAGMKRMFPELKEAVATVLDPSTIRWISFSHFEVDECGALNDWLALAPHAEAACSFVGARVNLDDFSSRPARGLADGERLETGKYRFRHVAAPHLPHGWDAGFLFEETHRTLLCSDLFTHGGEVEALTEADVVGRARETMVGYQGGPFCDYMPFSSRTMDQLEKLASLKPKTLALMHGSTFVGDGASALMGLGQVMREVLGAS
jgi:flavorubredoxin